LLAVNFSSCNFDDCWREVKNWNSRALSNWHCTTDNIPISTATPLREDKGEQGDEGRKGEGKG